MLNAIQPFESSVCDRASITYVVFIVSRRSDIVYIRKLVVRGFRTLTIDHEVVRRYENNGPTSGIRAMALTSLFSD